MAADPERAVHPATPRGDGTIRYPRDRPNLSPAGTSLGSAARSPHTEGAFVQYAFERAGNGAVSAKVLLRF